VIARPAGSDDTGRIGEPPGVAIELLTEETALDAEAELMELLQDAVDSGASVGFLPPLTPGENRAYWQSVVVAVRTGSRLLLGARDGDGRLVGTAQLDLAARANARHRAEVMKVIVHRAARRRGIGRALMRAVEEHARRLRRSTLVLDTRQGDPSERLYGSVGYRLAGTIPRYARSADGRLDPSAFYYKVLEEEREETA
jgi:acetyltransferase